MNPVGQPPSVGDPVVLFKALADPVRLNLFTRIIDVAEMPCTRLVDEAEVSASTVSYHVKQLAEAGLIAVRKEGRNYHYTARADTLVRLQGFVTDLAVTSSQTCTGDQKTASATLSTDSAKRP